MSTFGNPSNAATSVATGYIVNATGSLNGVLVHVGTHILIAIVCYLFVVGEIKHAELEPL